MPARTARSRSFPKPWTGSRGCSIRRFYETVEVDAEAGGYAVRLDGRAIRTPGGAALRLPTRRLADAIADEWAAQGERVRPRSMALMQLAATAIDRVPGRRGEIVDELTAYAESELLCHRAEAPVELARRQTAAWQPLLDWAAAEHGAALEVTEGVMPRAQPAPALDACRAAVDAFDDMALAALYLATTTAGSLIVGLALAADRISPEEAWAVSLLDETYQIEQWGLDPEAERRRAAIRADFDAAHRFLALLAG